MRKKRNLLFLVSNQTSFSEKECSLNSKCHDLVDKQVEIFYKARKILIRVHLKANCWVKQVGRMVILGGALVQVCSIRETCPFPFAVCPLRALQFPQSCSWVAYGTGLFAAWLQQWLSDQQNPCCKEKAASEWDWAVGLSPQQNPMSSAGEILWHLSSVKRSCERQTELRHTGHWGVSKINKEERWGQKIN